ncbi:LysR family transcriptional regulator [Streptomyces sp. NPDC057702]|uniref:LysR family transcriptional regulator n=1 Tax=unclassified Streptomyces TaxID=2593676 RepID=UPI0036A7ED56
MDLEMRHLRAIRTIAEAGSLTRAAATLGLAQPALSAQLKRIESALGGRLFERGRYGVRTTALGDFVLDRARILLPAVGQLQREAVRLTQDGERAPDFRLGGTHGPLLGAVVDRLADAHPGVQVTTRIAWSDREIAASVADGRLNFALIGTCGESTPPEPDRLVWRQFAVDPIFVMLSDHHPLAARPEVDLAELAEEAWAVVPGDGCFGECFTAACARAGFRPGPLYETDIASCVYLAQVGRAVGLCRATLPTPPGMVTRPLAGTPLMWRHLIGWDPYGPGVGVASEVVAHAHTAHTEAAARSESYAAWLATRGASLWGPASDVEPAGSLPGDRSLA